MTTIFDKATRDALINRINKLEGTEPPQWGSMTVGQMLKHQIMYEEMFLGKLKIKRALLGYLFGKFALKDLTKDEYPIKPNLPTIPAIKITGAGEDVGEGKKKWISLLEEYPRLGPDHKFFHAFFGIVTKEQAGLLVCKHVDHHLRQFGA
ncbi:MAG: DinB family protein [Bacteroidota bacterium]